MASTLAPARMAASLAPLALLASWTGAPWLGVWTLRVLSVGAWLLAALWGWRVAAALLFTGRVPSLLDPAYDQHFSAGEGGAPLFAVIVPACNEEAAIEECLRSLLDSVGLPLEIFAVNDRSTDATGEIMERVAAEGLAAGKQIRVIHITELPAGWLGKPHALALAARQTSAPYLLFTDADAFFHPDALRRSFAYLQASAADHLVLTATPILKSAGERMMIGMIQALSIWAVRLWRIADPSAKDTIGVGCFTLLRREVYLGIGGFESMRMEVLEDVCTGYRVKKQGYRQRVATGPGLLRLHWAPGALGIVRGVTKNFFALCRYNLAYMLVFITGMALVTLAPFLALLGPWPMRSSGIFVVVALLILYGRDLARTRVGILYALLFPVAGALCIYAMLRSATITLAQGGVRWRGTFYPLSELRRHASPLR